MARTNARTQRMIGMILCEASCFLDHLMYHLENMEEKYPDFDMHGDDDFMKAYQSVRNIISREAAKNEDREIGFWLENVKEA